MPLGILNQHADLGAKRDSDLKKKKKNQRKGWGKGGMDWEVGLADASCYV